MEDWRNVIIPTFGVVLFASGGFWCHCILDELRGLRAEISGLRQAMCDFNARLVKVETKQEMNG